MKEDDKQHNPEGEMVPTNKSDKDLIKSIILFIMENMMKRGVLYRQGFIGPEIMRIKPLFCVKYLVKEKIKVQQKPK